MNKNVKHIFKGLVIILIMTTSCVEQIPLETESFESVLIVEATITNESKQHEILLSRSYKLGGSGPIHESDATVKVIDDVSNTYTFIESEPGKYLSQTEFAAQANRIYKLSIITSDGREYASNKKQLTQETVIDNLYAERSFNENEVEGVSIYIDSYDATGNSKYYRHEYEETYKIIAPLYSSEELISNGVVFPILSDNTPVFDSLDELVDFLVTKQPREEQEQICYKTVESKSIMLISTSNFLEDKLEKYRIRFVGMSNSEIRHRYSILARQFVQSREAFVFYETLNSFSESENVFSENQPGFLEGNIFSVENKTENVFGFFEVTSVDEKRIFFNYEEIFPNENTPPFFVDCDEFYTPALLAEDFAHNWISSPLVDAINEGYQYYEDNVDSNNSPFFYAPFRLVLEPCGDCTFLGNNNIPDFWEE